MREKRIAFVLRLWTETADLDPHATPALRGSLQRADTGQVHYFAALDDLPAILRGLMGWSNSAQHSNAGEDDT